MGIIWPTRKERTPGCHHFKRKSICFARSLARPLYIYICFRVCRTFMGNKIITLDSFGVPSRRRQEESPHAAPRRPWPRIIFRVGYCTTILRTLFWGAPLFLGGVVGRKIRLRLPDVRGMYYSICRRRRAKKCQCPLTRQVRGLLGKSNGRRPERCTSIPPYGDAKLQAEGTLIGIVSV